MDDTMVRSVFIEITFSLTCVVFRARCREPVISRKRGAYRADIDIYFAFSRPDFASISLYSASFRFHRCWLKAPAIAHLRHAFIENKSHRFKGSRQSLVVVGFMWQVCNGLDSENEKYLYAQIIEMETRLRLVWPV